MCKWLGWLLTFDETFWNNWFLFHNSHLFSNMCFAVSLEVTAATFWSYRQANTCLETCELWNKEPRVLLLPIILQAKAEKYMLHYILDSVTVFLCLPL